MSRWFILLQAIWIILLSSCTWGPGSKLSGPREYGNTWQVGQEIRTLSSYTGQPIFGRPVPGYIGLVFAKDESTIFGQLAGSVKVLPIAGYKWANIYDSKIDGIAVEPINTPVAAPTGQSPLSTSDEIRRKLRNLEELKTTGTITNEEYNNSRSKLLLQEDR